MSPPPRNASRRRAKDGGATLKRLLSYIRGRYRVLFILVVFCILVNSVTTVAAALFLQSLIDDFIVPLIRAQTPDASSWSPGFALPCRIIVHPTHEKQLSITRTAAAELSTPPLIAISALRAVCAPCSAGTHSAVCVSCTKLFIIRSPCGPSFPDRWHM